MRLTMLLALSMLVATGCTSTLIFKADFDNDSGSPQGPPPGAPADDQITVQSPANPYISGAALRFKPPGNKGYFFSRTVKKADTTKTVFWTGHMKSGDGPFSFLISGHNTPGTPFLTNPVEIRFTNNLVQVIGLPPNNTVLHSHALVANTEHDVFVSLRLKTGTYRITIQQAGAPEIEFPGTLDPLTANWIKGQSRIVLQAGFLFNATSTDEYFMDDIIMRERD